MPGTTDKPGFHLASTSQGFNSRSDDIFGGLDLLASQHAKSTEAATSEVLKADPVDEPISGSDQGRFSDCPTHYYRPRKPKARKQESTARHSEGGHFRAPLRRPPRSNRLPDYKRNPGKWTCYDLSDVSKDHLSERSNTAAALEFLQERKRLRETPSHTAGSSSTSGMDAEESDKHQKHVFVKKTTEKKSEEKSTEETPKFAGAKRVMPEYTVGANKFKASKEKRPSSSVNLPSCDSVLLSHLDDEQSGDKNKDSSIKVVAMEECGSTRDQPQLADGKTDNCETEGLESKVKFKSRKGKNRASVRQRHDDDEKDSE